MKKITGVFKWFRALPLKYKIILAVLVVVLLFLFSRLLFGSSKKQQISTDTVKKATIVDTVSESGNVQSNQLTVYSISNGVIEELYVKNGQEVEKGAKLFRVKSTASDQDKAEAWTNYQSAVSSQKTAEQNKLTADATVSAKKKAVYDAQNDVNYKNEHDENPTTQDDYTKLEKKSIDTALSQAKKDLEAANQKYAESDIAIDAAKAQVNSTWIKYQATQDAVITAQVSGTIANLAYSVGDQVTAEMATSGSNTNTTASSVLVIGTNTDSVVKIQVNEVDINKVNVGQTANVTISAIKDKTFKGEVTRVDAYGTSTSDVITYNIYIKITEPDSQIRPLMSAVVVIETAKHENALVVPNSAVKPYKGGKAVQVKDTSVPGNSLKYVQVKTGIKTSTQTEILEGLTEGMEIVTSTSAATTTSSGGLFSPPSSGN